MPFIEVFDFQATQEQRRAAGSKITEALCDAYGIVPDIVSTYFFDINSTAYAHAGFYPAKSMDRRIFVKIHAFRRDVGMRRKAAHAITAAAVEAYEADPSSLIVYFLDRDPSEVAHGGKLASD